MAVAGWYPDPERLGRIRWWDGFHWTADTRSAAPVPSSLGAAAPVVVQSQPALPHLPPQYLRAIPVVEVPGGKCPARLALTSVILGGAAILFGWFVPAVGLLFGPAGLVLGIVALVIVGSAPARTVSSATSRQLAITGVVVSGAAMLFAIGAAIVWAGINST